MKKVLYFAAVCAALVGCAKVEVREYVPDANPIVFNSPVVGSSTKAAIVGNTYPQKSFSVWALYTNTDLATDGTDKYLETAVYTKEEFLKGVKFNYVHATTDYFAGNAFWPKAVAGGSGKPKLHFHAISPALAAEGDTGTLVDKDGTDAGSGTVTHRWVAGTGEDAYVGFKVTGFAIESTPSEQRDLLTSSISFNQYNYYVPGNVGSFTEPDSGTASSAYTGNDITFRHALASIRFDAKLGSADASVSEYYITKIELYGHKTTGTFTESLTPNGYSFEDEMRWDVSGGVAVASDSKIDIGITNTTSALNRDGSTKQALYNGATGTYLVIPQNLNEVYIVITYSEKIGDITNDGLTATCSLASTGGKVSGTTDNYWYPNRRYTYTITINRNQIILDPIVEDWTNVTDRNLGI